MGELAELDGVLSEPSDAVEAAFASRRRPLADHARTMDKPAKPAEPAERVKPCAWRRPLISRS